MIYKIKIKEVVKLYILKLVIKKFKKKLQMS